MKFTFKTTKPTGRYSSFRDDFHDIKIKGIVVGTITDETWKINLMVEKADIMEDGNPNCQWKWIRLKKESNSLQEAKDFLNANFKEIMRRWNIYIKKEEGK